MNEPAQNQDLDADRSATLEAQTDAAIAVCGGNVRAALQAALVANSFLMAEVELRPMAGSLTFTGQAIAHAHLNSVV